MDYKNTVFLPKTQFPMKANLAKRENDFIDNWNRLNLYEKLRKKSKGREKFILHYGPPYANGNIHIGHALTETLKDVVVKTYQMLGYDAPLVPGWDCHGLPIEWKIEESYRAAGLNKDDVPVLEFREECRSFAEKWIAIQKKEFKRLGIVADWENPYSTMTFENEAYTIEQFGKFLLDGSLYRGLKPVLWSVVEKTALAEAEVDYKDHVSDSIYVAFPVTHPSNDSLEGVEVVIWTTTPWTLPGNRAIAYGAEISYGIVRCLSSNRQFLIAESLIESVMAACAFTDYKIEKILPAYLLKGTLCAHPMAPQGYNFDVPLLPGDHVTTEVGTGLVHTAPSHGLEDFELGKIFGLEVPETIKPDGFYNESIPVFSGLHIFKANPKIMEVLSENGRLLHSAKITHSYPHSWRSKAPLIYRATAQWFVSMEKTNLREKSLAAIDTVNWFPAQGKNRIRAMVENRPDWCLSRQRAWGTPITVFLNKKTGDVLRDAAVHQRIVEKVKQEGGDAWYKCEPGEFLGPDYSADDFEKVTDIIDVWFDSGCTHYYVLQKRPELSWPADLYLEGSDQHRGWFQSSLLASCGATGHAPYKSVMTHGFTLDEKGYKMSKSTGNVVAPEKIINTIGADILRLWIVSVDYSEDMRIGPDILKQQEDIYRRLRNTLRYLLGSLEGYDETEALDYSEMPGLEKWVLHRLAHFDAFLRECAKKYDFTTFYSHLHDFCASDLSAFYLDIRKDSLYCDDKTSVKRRAARTVMSHIFDCLCLWLAPVLSFTAEEAWQTRYSKSDDHSNFDDSVHLQDFPSIPTQWSNPEVAQTWDCIRGVRRVVTGALEVERAAKTIGSSLQARVAVYMPEETARYFKGVDLAEIFIISDADLLIAQPPAGAFVMEDVENIGVIVNEAKGEKCNRCWKILPEVEKNPESLCERCHYTLTEKL